MIQTLLNEANSVNYPFIQSESLPFPNSCILDMGICIRKGTFENDIVYVSGVDIGEDAVTVTISGVVGTYSGAVAMLVAYGQNMRSSTLIRLYDVPLTGFLITGSVPPSAIGSFKGAFGLAPGVVTVLSTEVAGKVTAVEDMTGSYALTGNLEIGVDGLLEAGACSSSGAICISADVTGIGRDRLLELPYHGYKEYVTSVAGATHMASADAHRLIIRSADLNIGVAVDNTGVTDPSTVCVVITGSGGFPNCFAAGADQAGKTDEELAAEDEGEVQ